jgi:lipopolysaccharide export system protein LptA
MTCLAAASIAFAGPEQVKGPEPIVITAGSLTANNKAHTALFKGSVVVTKGEVTMNADHMLVYYKEGGSGNSSVDRIEATGNVKVVKGARVITSGKAVYHAGANERIVFTDSPRAMEGQNMVTGTVMTYYVQDDRSFVENSKVFMVNKETPRSEAKKP